MRSVLNVGGGTKTIPIPPHFDGWRHDLLDIDPKGNPDVLADARDLKKFPPATYDAIYCSHNLEHYYRHDAVKVVQGFHHLLKPDGFAQIMVPDILALIFHVAQNKLDPEDVLYESSAGPIRVRDTIYGFQPEIEASGNDFYAHKTCFSIKSLNQFMFDNGFPLAGSAHYEPFGIIGFFFKQPPTAELCRLLKISQE